MKNHDMYIYTSTSKALVAILSVAALDTMSQVNTQSDQAVKEKAFSALMSAVQKTQQERAVILNALVRMRMRHVLLFSPSLVPDVLLV